MREADAHFADPRLAEIYDVLDGDRRDLGPYIAMVEELNASNVLDLGCGTGTFACHLAIRGVSVVGIDPAAASVEVARRKPGADQVHWIVGDVTAVLPLQMDMVIMTGNVAQVFLTNQDWTESLQAAYTALKPGGRLVFETRDPASEAWRSWTRAQTYNRVDVPEIGEVENWKEITDDRPPLVSFRTTFVFASDGAVLTSDSTLRFRERSEIVKSLRASGFTMVTMRDAPDRPGLEMVFVASKPTAAGQRRGP